MALPNTFSLSGLSAAYIFTFDLPIGLDHWLDDRTAKRLTDLSVAYYQTSQDTFTSRGEGSPELLKAYHEEMYNTRFKRSALNQRHTTVLQLPGQSCFGLSGSTSQVIRADEQVPVEVCCTLNEMGVASLVLWFEFIPSILFDLEALRTLRSPTLSKTQVNWSLGPSKRRYSLSGLRSIEDLARFVVITLFCELRPNRRTEEIRRSVNSRPLVESHGELCRRATASLSPSPVMDSYPAIFSDLSQAKATNEEINEWTRRKAPEIRGLLTGDKNWARKRVEIAVEFLSDYSFSTRDSIWWYTHPNCSLKIYSQEMDTSLLTSKVLLVFEVEYLLLMKHFAYRIIRNLNSLNQQAKRTIPLRRIASLRDQEMRRLDEYYNLDVLQKDTTAKRLKHFHAMLRVGDIVAIASHKLESLNVLLNTEFQGASIRRALALSIIFGVFGAGKLLFSLLDKFSEENGDMLSFGLQASLTGIGMLVVGLAILLIFGRPRIR